MPLAVAYSTGFTGRGLLAGRYYTLLSSLLLAPNRFVLASVALSLVVTLGLYEVLVGSGRAALVAVTAVAAGRLVVPLVLAGGSALKVDFAAQALSTLEYGASVITAGAAGALVTFLERRWLSWTSALIVLGGVIVHHHLVDWEHLVAYSFGVAVTRTPRRLAADRGLNPIGARSVSTSSWHLLGIAGTLLGVLAGAVGASAVVGGPTSQRAVGVPAMSSGDQSSALSTVKPSSPLRVVDTHYPTPSLGGERRVLVILPAGYDSGGVRYPVIEVLHGSPGGPEDLLAAEDLGGVVASKPQFIAIVPDGHGPIIADGDFADTSRQRLGAAVSEDLQLWADATLRTNGLWDVTGLSSGGFGAAYLASRPAGGYRRVCTMSGYFAAEDPAFEGEPRAVRDAASPILHVATDGPPTMIIVGNADKEELASARSYIAALTRVRQAHELVVLPGAHDASVWRSGLARCVSFLLGAGIP